MLLKFKTKNFKSFVEEIEFSMIPAPKQKDLNYSILKNNVSKKTYKGLCSAVIYGPNASGKTNIIGAMDAFKELILKGNIRNSDNVNSFNISSYKLELIPNRNLKKVRPTLFSIEFITNNMHFLYEVEIELGLFLQEGYDRKIISENLFINEKPIYKRTSETIEFFNLGLIKEYTINDFQDNESSVKKLAKNNLNSYEFFLNNGFKLMFSSKIVIMILDWLENEFKVIYRADSLETNKKISDPKVGTVYIQKTMNEAAEVFGINSNAIGYMTPKDDGEVRLCSVFEDLETSIPAEFFESFGTVRFVNLFPLIMGSLLDGTTLILDEFDAHIHPIALMNIINLYHNDDINKKNAQLIFNTHNPIFLNSNIFRRDEIKFVERDASSHKSIHYSLSDFKTSGPNGVRKGEDYMDKYFVGRYGAINNIDFLEIFEKELLRRTSKDGDSNG